MGRMSVTENPFWPPLGGGPRRPSPRDRPRRQSPRLSPVAAPPRPRWVAVRPDPDLLRRWLRHVSAVASHGVVGLGWTVARTLWWTLGVPLVSVATLYLGRLRTWLLWLWGLTLWVALLMYLWSAGWGTCVYNWWFEPLVVAGHGLAAAPGDSSWHMTLVPPVATAPNSWDLVASPYDLVQWGLHRALWDPLRRVAHTALVWCWWHLMARGPEAGPPSLFPARAAPVTPGYGPGAGAAARPGHVTFGSPREAPAN